MSDQKTLIDNLKKNQRQINMVLTIFTTMHNRAVRKNTRSSDLSLDNLYAKTQLPLQMAILEIEYLKLVHSEFDVAGRFLNENTTLAKKSEEEKWILLLDFLIKDRYGSLDKSISARTVGATTYARYELILKLIKDDLAPYMQLRNRLAHGQWHCLFSKDPYSVLTETNSDLTTQAWVMTKRETMMIKAFVKWLPKLMRTLIESKSNFEKHFDKNLNGIIAAKEDADEKYNWVKTRGRV